MDGKDAMPLSGRVDTARARVRLTYEDFLRFPDDGKRHELIDGVHYVTPSPNRPHQQLIGRLYYAIESYLRAHPGTGEVFLSPFDVVFSLWDVVEPDVLFVAADQPEILTEANVQGAPALVIEVLSRSTRKRDETIKRKLFERGGVREYWLVDPTRHAIRIFRRSAERRLPEVGMLHLEESASLTTPLFPGFSLALAELFAGV